MVRMVAAATLGSILSVTTVSTAQVWEKKPPESWTTAEARHLLESSPWSGKATLRAFLPPHVRSAGARRPNRLPPDLHVHVIWSSGRMMRQAAAQADLPQWAPAGVPLAVTDEPADYMVTAVFRSNGPFLYYSQMTVVDPQPRLVAGSKSLSPSAATVVVRDREGQSVTRVPGTGGCNEPPPQRRQMSPWTNDPQFWGRSVHLPRYFDGQYVREPNFGPPDPVQPQCHLATVVTFTFPKAEAFTIADREVTFELMLENFGLSVRRTFDLRRMTIAGVLD